MTQKALWKQHRKWTSLWNCPFKRHRIWETCWVEEFWRRGQNLGDQKSKAVTDGVTLCSRVPSLNVSSLASSHADWRTTYPYHCPNGQTVLLLHTWSPPQDWAKWRTWEQTFNPGSRSSCTALVQGQPALRQWPQEAKRVWSSFMSLCQALSPSAAVTCLLAGTGCELPDGESWAQGSRYFFVTSHRARPTLLPPC